jgi:hypothetical protein
MTPHISFKIYYRVGEKPVGILLNLVCYYKNDQIIGSIPNRSHCLPTLIKSSKTRSSFSSLRPSFCTWQHCIVSRRFGGLPGSIIIVLDSLAFSSSSKQDFFLLLLLRWQKEEEKRDDDQVAPCLSDRRIENNYFHALPSGKPNKWSPTAILWYTSH